MTDTPNRLYRTIETPDGPVDYQVNRRGCTGPVTPEFEEAMQALVRAVHAQYRAKSDAPSAPPGPP